MNKYTQAAHWRENGEPDPHAKCTDQERSELPLGNLTDDELANAVFLHGDTVPPIAEVIAGTAKMPIVYLTAAKERLRWLSRKLVGAEQSMQEARTKIASLLMQRSDTGLAIDAALRDGVVPEHHPLRSRLEMLANHRQREQELLEAVALATHQVITCGVAAKHPDANLSRRESDYGGKWDSPQAESVRQLRQERDELLAALEAVVSDATPPGNRAYSMAKTAMKAISKAKGGAA